MNYTTIYEIGPMTISPIFIIVVLVLILLLAYGIIAGRNSDKISRISFNCTIAFFLVMAVLGWFNNHSVLRELSQKYESGNYEVAEGIIENFRTHDDTASDEFMLDGIYFRSGRNGAYGYGYPTFKRDGGLLDNGVWCKIYYIPMPAENVIMKVMILKE